VKRINEKDKEALIAAIKDELSRTPEGRYYHRLHVVLHYLQENSSSAVALFYGHSARVIQYWIQRLLSSGLESLWDRERPGHPGQLSRSQRGRLRDELRRSPTELGYKQNYWNGPLLSNHLERHYTITLSIRQCQRILHQLRFSLRKTKSDTADGNRVFCF
jgi:transposase